MNAHLARAALAFSVLIAAVAALSAVAGAATPEEETRFVSAVRKAFDDRKGAGLAELTYWEGVGEKERADSEKMYGDLVTQKDVTWEFKLVDASPKDLAKRAAADARDGRRVNLAITKQLDMTFRDKDGKRILGIIGWAVGEKDGRLMMVRSVEK